MISPTELRAAAEALRAGKLVAFPTETVYGLGADALDARAVARIFEVKGRPATSPLIVHICAVAQARELAAEWPDKAQALAAAFWPGPLTIVVPKRRVVPDIVTAGLGSVGLRVPAHAVALALIREAGVPVAAPSANRFTELSPTRAEHVRRSLGDRIDLILDGGPALVGIESTVVQVEGDALRILRPGMITRQQIERVAGVVSHAAESTGASHASPGMHARHYQPKTRLILARADQLPAEGQGVFLARGGEMPDAPAAYAEKLYDLLHQLDARGLDWIAVEPPPAEPEWDGIRDRLERAATRDHQLS